LHVSQLALSGTIRSNEGDLGVHLFRRTSRQVELTDAGEVFAAEARRLIAEGERAMTLIRNSSLEIAGPVRVAYPASIDLSGLCSLVSDVRKGARLANGFQLTSAEGVRRSCQPGQRSSPGLGGKWRGPQFQCAQRGRPAGCAEFPAVFVGCNPQ
jgi:DNA-binding transcriptional LysR family regulator